MRSNFILLLILGSTAVLAGVFYKAQNWDGANLLLGAGLLTELVCAVMLVVYFWTRRVR